MDYNVSLEAEKSVLGSMILSQRAATKGATLLDGNDFFRPGHTLIFENALHPTSGCLSSSTRTYRPTHSHRLLKPGQRGLSTSRRLHPLF